MTITSHEAAAARAGLTVLLWSHSQRCLHVEGMTDTINSGMSAFIGDRPMDYVPIFIGTQGECDQIAAAVRARLQQREIARQQARDAMTQARQFDGCAQRTIFTLNAYEGVSSEGGAA